MANIKLGGTTAISESGGTVTLAGTLGSGVTFPAGHIVKVYHKVFKDRQAIARVSGNDSNNLVDSEYFLIGTGASGTSGDPLSITTDTPASNSSKYYIHSSVHTSREGGNSMFLRFFSGSAGITDADGLADTGDKDTAYAFGKSHWSTGGTDYGVTNWSMSYLWSPGSASAQTISVRGTGYNAGANTYINEGVNVGNASYFGTATSSLTVMEVA